MSDLGTDVGTNAAQMATNAAVQGARVGMEASKAILEMLKYILSGTADIIKYANDPTRKREKMEIELVKEVHDAKEARFELMTKEGNIDLEWFHKAQKADEALDRFTAELTEKQMERFSEISAELGVPFAGVKSKSEDTPNAPVPTAAPNTKYIYNMVFRSSDRNTLEDAMKIFNRENQCVALDEQITGYEKKGIENLHPEERSDYITCINERSSLAAAHRNDINNRTSSAIAASVLGGNPEVTETFESALNRETNKQINKNQTFVIADAQNPEKHIICAAAKAKFEEKEYIRTEYKGYDGDKEVFSTNDERFSNDPKVRVPAWHATRTKMQQDLNFGEKSLRFKDIDHYKAFMERRHEKSEQDITSPRHENNKTNYKDCITHLESELEKRGYTSNTIDGTPCLINKETNLAEVPTWKQRLTLEEKENIVAFIRAKQLENYKILESTEIQKITAQAEFVRATPRTPEWTAAKEKFNKFSETYNDAKKVEAELRNEMSALDSAITEYELRPEIEKLDKDLCELDKIKSEHIKYSIKIGDINELPANELPKDISAHSAIYEKTKYAQLYINDQLVHTESFDKNDSMLKAVEKQGLPKEPGAFCKYRLAEQELITELRNNWMATAPESTISQWREVARAGFKPEAIKEIAAQLGEYKQSEAALILSDSTDIPNNILPKNISLKEAADLLGKNSFEVIQMAKSEVDELRNTSGFMNHVLSPKSAGGTYHSRAAEYSKQYFESKYGFNPLEKHDTIKAQMKKDGINNDEVISAIPSDGHKPMRDPFKMMDEHKEAAAKFNAKINLENAAPDVDINIIDTDDIGID